MENFLYKKSPLFQGVKIEDMNKLLQCLSARVEQFNKDNYIFSEGEPANEIGVIVSGVCQIVKDDFWGNRAILAHLVTGDNFGEAFCLSNDRRLKVSVVAVDSCEVMFINSSKVVSVCPSSCMFHSQLIKNILKSLANKNINLTDKIEFITRKTTREKALAYFSSVAKQQKNNRITIPFDRQGLADYLSVERSALSFELSRMKKEGLIDYHKNIFLLKK